MRVPTIHELQAHPFSGQDVPSLLAARAAERGAHPFLIWEPFEGPAKIWSYAEFATKVDRVAAGLMKRGVEAGDRLLVHLDNCPESLFTWYACARIGAVAVTTNARSSGDELSYFAEHSAAVAGTTSRPKGVLWTHANALWGARVNAVHEGLAPADVHMTFLPMFHTNAQAYSVLASLWAGATVVLQPRFSARRFWPVALKHRCSWASVVPFCIKALLEQPTPKEHFFRMWGSAICEPPTDAHFGVRTIGWWGMTETITHGIVGDHFGRNRPMMIGRPAPEYGIAIRHDDGSPVAPGETGHLAVFGIRGLSLFMEYLNNPQATQESFDEAGWFRTGDRVTLHPDGYIQFADRAKDMLKVGGENVAASEIERVIMVVPGVREVAVVGRKHPMLDEVPVAVVLADGAGAAAAGDLAERVLAACRTSLADFKVPREVRLVDALPRSTLEKIAKNELRRQLEAETRMPETAAGR